MGSHHGSYELSSGAFGVPAIIVIQKTTLTLALSIAFVIIFSFGHLNSTIFMDYH